MCMWLLQEQVLELAEAQQQKEELQEQLAKSQKSAVEWERQHHQAAAQAAKALEVTCSLCTMQAALVLS